MGAPVPLATMSERPTPPGVPAELCWTVHPAARSPARALAVAGVVLLAALLAWRITGSTLLAALALLLLGLSVADWFLPRTYTLDGAGARLVGFLCRSRRLAWHEVRRVSAAHAGVHLSPLHSDSRFLPDRGIFLRTNGNRAQVLAFSQAHRTQP